MKKQGLLALMLVLAMVLTGCTLVQKDPAVDAATEIIRLGDAVVTKGEIQEATESQLNYMAYVYSMYGRSFDPEAEQSISDARNAVIDSFKQELVSNAKIAELGLDQLTAEEETKVQEDAEKTYQSNLDYILSSNYADSDLTDEEKNEKAKAELEATGYSMERALKDARETVLSDKLRAEIIKDVTVTDEEIQADYDSKVEADKTTYETSAGTWATAANRGTTLYYTPAGVRFVKQILVKFKEEDQTKINAANEKVTAAQSDIDAAQAKIDAAQETLDNENATEEDKAAAQTAKTEAEGEKTGAEEALAAAQKEADDALEAAFANIDADADGILAELENGADWDTLMADRTQDPGMQSGITAERGYAVTADMTGFDPAFVTAAMALEKVGDVSGKTRGDTYGYYIIKYVGDSAEGPIALDEVKESIRSSLQSSKETTTYNDTIQAWVDAADFKVDLGALNN